MMMNRLVDPGLILLSHFFLKRKHQFVTRSAVAGHNLLSYSFCLSTNKFDLELALKQSIGNRNKTISPWRHSWFSI